MSIKTIFENYLNEAGRLKEEKLGPGTSKKSLSKEENLQFAALLKKQVNFNNTIIIVAIIGLLIIFIVDLYFIFFYRDQPKTIAFLFSGTFLSLIGVIRWLRRLWMEKTVFDVSLGVLQELPPEEAIKFIEVTYWKIINK